MLSRNDPDRIQIAFDDHRLVANAGLLLPVTLAHHLGLGHLVDHHVDLGDAPVRANGGDKLLTLVASALAGGDCIDDADALRAGGTEPALGCVVKAPSTLGTFLRSFRWGHVRQLDRVSRELLARGSGSDNSRHRRVPYRRPVRYHLPRTAAFLPRRAAVGGIRWQSRRSKRARPGIALPGGPAQHTSASTAPRTAAQCRPTAESRRRSPLSLSKP